ncbi:MAG: glycosyltransferase family 39 protein [Anaerolineae bacterium]|jgi:mannosyltransferase
MAAASATRRARWSALAWRLAPWVLMGLALALSLYRIDAQSLWYDEGWSIELAGEGPGRVFGRLRDFADPHPPGYYLLLIAWGRLFGRSVTALRAFSALLGALTVGAIYHVGRRLFDRAGGLVAALVLALSPLAWVYAQEMRMYTLLLLCLTPLLGLTARYALQRATWRPSHWAALIALEALALYTHFFAVIALGALALWLGLRLVRAGRRGDWRPCWRWLGSQAVVLALYAPWLSVALDRALGHTTRAGAAPPLLDYLRSSWTFLVGGHIDLAGREPLFVLLALGAGGALALASLLALADDRRRVTLAYLLLQVALPLLAVYAVMLLRPGYHPRYIMMTFPALALLIGGVAVTAPRLPCRIRPAGLALLIAWAAAWGAASGLAWRALRTDAHYAHDDARGAAALLRAQLPPDSLVVMSHSEWALRYYLRDSGLAQLYLPPGDDPAAAIEAVDAALAGASGAARVAWGQADVDFGGLYPYLLERHGALLRQERVPGYALQLYAIDAAPPALAPGAADVRFGPLRLVSATVEARAPADEAVTVALAWHPEAPLDHAYKVALSLVDQAGRTIARRDAFLLDSAARDTSAWAVGQQVPSFHTLPLPAGVAPVDHDLVLSVYHEGDPAGLDLLDAAGAPAGKALRLATVTLAPARGRVPSRAVDRAALGLIELPGHPSAAPGLALVAATAPRARYRSGEALSVLLEWQAAASPLRALEPALELVRAEGVVAARAAAPVYGRYPTTRWQPGQTVLDWRELTVPPDVTGGPASLQVRVPGQAPILLGQVELEAVARLYTAPPTQRQVAARFGALADAVGYTLSTREPAAGEPLSVTLVWQALAPADQDLVVFVHLLGADGRVVAQHDGPPAGGERATTGWVAGEYIVDPHTLQWSDAGYTGPAQVEVGLYDPATGQRLLLAAGESRLLLPEPLLVR